MVTSETIGTVVSDIVAEYMCLKYCDIMKNFTDIKTIDAKTKPGSIIITYNNGDECYYNADINNRVLHNTDDYAVRLANGACYCFVDGKPHSVYSDGELLPSISADGSMFYYHEGKLHREGANYYQPTVTLSNGSRYWFDHGEISRLYDVEVVERGEALTYDSPGAAIELVDGGKLYKAWVYRGVVVKVIQKPAEVKLYTEKEVCELLTESARLNKLDRVGKIRTHDTIINYDYY